MTDSTQKAPTVVALVPADRAVDPQKLAAATTSSEVRPTPATVFPFKGARVFMDQSVLSADSVWLEAGSPVICSDCRRSSSPG